MNTLLLPSRLNFTGGWSDQPDWKYPAAVVNASIGWQHDAPYSPYTMAKGFNRFDSAVEGIGTGLGISSIRAAANFIWDNGSGGDMYIKAGLMWEKENGTCGGWQDQIGAIEPSLKCIRSANHETFDIEQLDGTDGVLDPADLFAHLLLFDTGIRRPARPIGDKVRSLFDSKPFISALRANVQDAQHAYQMNTERFALAALEGWRRLCDHVPEMAVDLPVLHGAHGAMLMGAGGGGFGVAFLTAPNNFEVVARKLQNDAGMKSYRPVLLGGARWCEEETE